MTQSFDHEFEGEIARLASIDSAKDSHEAVGLWWAKAVLRGTFDNGATDDLNTELRNKVEFLAASGRTDKERAVIDFAQALARLSRERTLECIQVDYNPDEVLMDAAQDAGMPANELTTFPWKTVTVNRNGVVIACEGYNGQPQQIWPPIEN